MGLDNHIEGCQLALVVFCQEYSFAEWVERDTFDARGAAPLEIRGLAQVGSGGGYTTMGAIPAARHRLALASEKVVSRWWIVADSTMAAHEFCGSRCHLMTIFASVHTLSIWKLAPLPAMGRSLMLLLRLLLAFG